MRAGRDGPRGPATRAYRRCELARRACAAPKTGRRPDSGRPRTLTAAPDRRAICAFRALPVLAEGAEAERVDGIGEALVEPRHVAGHEHEPERREQRGRDERDHTPVPFEPGHRFGDTAQTQADGEEREPEAESVRRRAAPPRAASPRSLRPRGPSRGSARCTASTRTRTPRPRPGPRTRRGARAGPALGPRRRAPAPVRSCEPARYAASSRSTTPERRVSSSWLSRSVWPSADAPRPSSTKTVVIPSVKSPVLMAIRRRWTLRASASSALERPVIRPR